MVRLYFVTIALLLGIMSNLYAVQWQQRTEGSLELLTVRNRYFTVDFACSSGGRVRSLIPHSDGIERIYWADNGVHSGLLDDKVAFTATPYQLSILEQDEELLVFALAAPPADYQLTKIFTINDAFPGIQVNYVYRNISAEPLDQTHMVRNYYLAGGQAGPEDNYYWRGARGVETQAYPYGDVGQWHEVERPWYAVLDSQSHTGMAWLVNSEYLRYFYNWADNSPANPAVEWQVKLTLQPGQEISIPVDLIFYEGFDQITEVNPQSVIGIQSQADQDVLTFTMDCLPLRILENLDFRFDYETLDRIFIWGETGMHFTDVQPGNILHGSTIFNAPAQGTYVVMVDMQSQNQSLQQFEFPVVVGQSSGNYYLGHREGSTARALATVTDEDIPYGYVLTKGGNSNPLPPIDSLEFTVGTDEYESLEITLLALRDVGDVRVSLLGDELLRRAFVIQTESAVVGTNAQLRLEDYAIVPGYSQIFHSGDHKSFWFTLQPGVLEPGLYAGQIIFESDDNPARNVHLLVNVVDIQQPILPQPTLTMYHTFNYIAADWPDHAQLMNSHYIRQLMLHFNFNLWRNAVSIHRDNQGILQINYGSLDRYLQEALEFGFTTIGLMYTGFNNDWFAEFEEDGQPDHELRQQFANLLVEHLYDLGFQQVWFYAIDEPAIDYALAPETQDRLRGFNAIHPRLKLHTTINHYAPRLVNILNPLISIWTPSSGICPTLLDDLEQGTAQIEASDNVGFYTGAFIHNPADTARGSGWHAARHQLDYFSLFAYNQASQRHPDWRCFADGPEGPVTTSVLEGIRDGVEDFHYWHLYDQLCERLRSRSLDSLDQQQQQRVQDALAFRDRVFSLSDDALIPSIVAPGGHGGRPWIRIENPDRWRFLQVKSELLQNLVVMEEALDLLDTLQP